MKNTSKICKKHDFRCVKIGTKSSVRQVSEGMNIQGFLFELGQRLFRPSSSLNLCVYLSRYLQKRGRYVYRGTLHDFGKGRHPHCSGGASSMLKIGWVCLKILRVSLVVFVGAARTMYRVSLSASSESPPLVFGPHMRRTRVCCYLSLFQGTVNSVLSQTSTPYLQNGYPRLATQLSSTLSSENRRSRAIKDTKGDQWKLLLLTCLKTRSAPLITATQPCLGVLGIGVCAALGEWRSQRVKPLKSN